MGIGEFIDQMLAWHRHGLRYNNKTVWTSNGINQQLNIGTQGGAWGDQDSLKLLVDINADGIQIGNENRPASISARICITY
jgi:hypothetical protein